MLFRSHYSLSHRDDTEYWRDVGSRSYCDVDKSMQEGTSDSKSYIYAYKTKYKDYTFDDDGLNAIGPGMHYFPVDLHLSHSQNVFGNDLVKEFGDITSHLNAKKDLWNYLASKQPTLYDFLKERIYNDEEEGREV